MAGRHFRCPACGQTRPAPAFERAGAHDLAAIKLQGLGFGRGFRRTIERLDLQALAFLGTALDRARDQVRAEQAACAAPAAAAAAARPVAVSSWCCHSPVVRFGALMRVCQRCGRSL